MMDNKEPKLYYNYFWNSTPSKNKQLANEVL